LQVASENGWEPGWVGQEALNWVDVPGCNPKVSIQIQKGQPTQILRALVADYNAFIEPVRDADCACYTPTNSVSTSNHLNGTAVDIRWDSHPFHVKQTFTPEQMKVVREVLAFYEGTVFWAGDWTDPIDEMHWQLGYNTYNNPKTADFIRRKIRPDGFSTMRRGGVDVGRPAPVDNAVLASARHAADGYESRSGYRTPGEGAIGGLDVFAVSDDAMLHTMFVEWSAIGLGDPDSIYRIVRAAAGRGANTTPEFRRRCRAAMAKIPRQDLSNVLSSIEKREPEILQALAAGMK
jgi:hypothetical protein